MPMSTSPCEPGSMRQLATRPRMSRKRDVCCRVWCNKAVIIVYGLVALVACLGAVAVLLARSYESALSATVDQTNRVLTSGIGAAAGGFVAVLSAVAKMASGPSDGPAHSSRRPWSNSDEQTHRVQRFREPFPDAEALAELLVVPAVQKALSYFAPAGDATQSDHLASSARRLAKTNTWYKEHMGRLEAIEERIISIGTQYSKLTAPCEKVAAVEGHAGGPTMAFSSDASSSPKDAGRARPSASSPSCPSVTDFHAWFAALPGGNGHWLPAALRAAREKWLRSSADSQARRGREAAEAILTLLGEIQDVMDEVRDGIVNDDPGSEQKLIEVTVCGMEQQAEEDIMKPMSEPPTAGGESRAHQASAKDTVMTVEEQHKRFAAVAVVCRMSMNQREGVSFLVMVYRHVRSWAQDRVNVLEDVLRPVTREAAEKRVPEARERAAEERIRRAVLDIVQMLREGLY